MVLLWTNGFFVAAVIVVDSPHLSFHIRCSYCHTYLLPLSSHVMLLSSSPTSKPLTSTV